MDILSKPVFEIGMSCYFLMASANNPSVYVRFKGEVRKVKSSDDRIIYYVAIKDVLENLDFIKKYIHQTSWRTVNTNGRYRSFKEFRVMDLLIRKSFNKAFCDRYKTELMVVPMSLIHQNENEMLINMKDMNKHLEEKLTSDFKKLKSVAERT